LLPKQLFIITKESKKIMSSSLKSSDDVRFMQYALSLGQRFLGQVAPNPAVGCVIVKEGVILSVGATQKTGRPHAERFALDTLARQGRLHEAQGATAYVTLEPCSHTGKTPPCALALQEAGIKRVVIALQDPDPRVNGRGVSLLQQAGISVTIGVCEQDAQAAHAGFLSKVTRKRPWVMAKLATSLDGCTATHSGHSQWITGIQARQFVHRLRFRYDALMTGIGTVLADNPLLTCRLAGCEAPESSPIRIIVDTHLRLPLHSKLVQTARHVPVWVMTHVSDLSRLRAYEEQGVKVFAGLALKGHSLDLEAVLLCLGEQGITRLMVESGQGLNTALLQENLIDTLVWMRSSFALGAEGLKGIGNLGYTTVDQAFSFHPIHTHAWETDRMEVYHNPSSPSPACALTVGYYL
jgi:diaminohydroxyphosphoribosylaminopyrimidine deaminase / 5-amino-6-(5-phosphoribosylamino)uracil reductase